MSDLNIKSSTIEKGLELAKEFLGKLISPTIEEVGLLISDNIKYLRFKNQVNILLKAKLYAEKKGIKVKELPLKILVPLLENASLEDEEEMQDKWASMITNMADSEYNFQNKVFPYILSQISIDEFNVLKKLLLDEKEHLIIKNEYLKLKERDKYFITQETRKIENKVLPVEQNGFLVFLEEFELANLVRLGLIKQMPPSIIIPEVSTGNDSHLGIKEHLQIEAIYDHDYPGFRITGLGEKFVDICEVK